MVNALYGEDAIIYIVIFTIPYNILIYTYGIMVMNGENNLSLKKVIGYIMNTGGYASCIALTTLMSVLTIPVVSMCLI